MDQMPPASQTPQSAMPQSNVVVEPKKNNTNTILMALIVVLLLILIGVGGFIIYKGYLVKNGTTYVTPSAYPTATVVALATATASASPTGTPTVSTGTVTGTVCYPASGIPDGKIYAKNVITSQVSTFDNQANNSTFSVSLSAGQYKFKYQPNGQFSSVVGYYTSCTGSEPVCQDNSTKRSSIVVMVSSSQTASGVKLCDYYYQAGMEPDF